MIITGQGNDHLGFSVVAHFGTKIFRVRPDRFVFEPLPTYSPELNLVEPCWQRMKNVHMANFVPLDVERLEAKACEGAELLNNDPKLLASFFHYAKLAR
jgi:transposase